MLFDKLNYEIYSLNEDYALNSTFYIKKDNDFISILKPGKTMILSPPDGNSLQFVRVTADGNVDVYKAYREPIAMPGMMGS